MSKQNLFKKELFKKKCHPSFKILFKKHIEHYQEHTWETRSWFWTFKSITQDILTKGIL